MLLGLLNRHGSRLTPCNRTNFTAEATVVIPTYNDSAVADSKPLIIHGSLSNFGNLTPAPIPAPPGASNPGCMALSEDPSANVFSVTKFLYQTTNISSYWPDLFVHDRPPTPWNRTLQVEFRNEATGLNFACSSTDRILDNPSNLSTIWLPCPLTPPPPPLPHTFPLYALDSSINLNLTTATLKINQTWYCNDTNTQPPKRFTALAVASKTSNPALVAGTSTTTANHTLCSTTPFSGGKIYCDVTLTTSFISLTNPNESHPLPLHPSISSLSIESLPPNALTSPDPTPSPKKWSCTISSLGRGPVEWTLRPSDNDPVSLQTEWFNWPGPDQIDWFGTAEGDQLQTRFRFDLVSSVFQGRPGSTGVIREVGVGPHRDEFQVPPSSARVALTPFLRGADPSVRYRNFDRFAGFYDWDPGFDFYEFLGWEVRFDAATGYLELEQAWYCDDKDPGTPYNLGPNRTQDRDEGIGCSLVGGQVTVTPTVSFHAMTTTVPDPVPFTTQPAPNDCCFGPPPYSFPNPLFM
ncbi:hypothetical protein QBC47DRAFT_292814 [Echria macrotheca]|uniref:Uncharacterized protein n=1 Tax=Echria macrotheca TaxID=438768 RepID=A0AAJ0BIV8_9PEZI|nr:hypothetical protein QBC47DRAFT_292814 [Echria macrotheca]